MGTTGDGSAATPLLSSPVTTDAGGNFNITGLYSCSAATEVYITAIGGNPGIGVTNPNIALMTALGPCTGLSANTFISINELTTVAAVYALAPFTGSSLSIGSGASDASSLASAFTLANQLVNPSTGAAPGVGLPPGMSVPVSKLDTLADILASCINSPGGAAGDGSVCGQLFSLTIPAAGTAPTNTLGASLNVAENPTLNTASLFQLLAPNSPFQPALSLTPSDFAISQTSSANFGVGLQIGPQSLAFPATPNGFSAAAQTIVLSNSGTTSVTLSGISIAGTNPADFTQSTTCPSALAAGANCSVSITFSPGAAGSRSGYLSVASSSPDSPQYVQLSGSGSVPAASGPHAVASTNALFIDLPGESYDVTLSNTGTAPLTIAGVSLAGTPFNSLANGCVSSLAPGASCIATIHSILAGADQLTFATNDPSFQSSIPIYSNGSATTLPYADLYFPNTVIGGTNVLSLTLSQTIPSPSITGVNASEYQVASACQGSGATQSCTLTVTFQPTASGFRTAQLQLDTYGDYIPLGGNGFTNLPNSAVTLAPASLDFSDAPAPQSLTLTNTGNSAMAIQSIALASLLGPSEYTETNNCGSSLPAQSLCTISVASSRRLQGGTQGLLTVAGDFGQFGVPLVNQLDPVVNVGSAFLSTTTLSYLVIGYQPPGSTVSATLSGNGSGDFGSQECFDFTQSCDPIYKYTLTDTFRPASTGIRSATLTIMDSVPFPHTVKHTLLGTGTTTPISAVTLSQAEFISDGSNSAEATLLNLGTGTLNLTGFTVSGASATGFVVGSNAPCTSLAPGASCAVPLTLMSPQNGFITADLNFEDSTTGQTFSEPVYSFNQLPPPVSASQLPFPDTQVSQVSAPISITVTPDHAHAITTSISTSITYNPFSIIKGSCAAGETPCILTFLFSPTSVGNASAQLEVVDSYIGTGSTVYLTGTGFIPGAASVSPTSLTFASRPAGSTSIPQVITFSNTGQGSIGISGISITGASAAEFLETSTCGTSLAPVTTCSISLNFAPQSAGDKTAALVISGYDSKGLPLTVPLSGTAQ